MTSLFLITGATGKTGAGAATTLLEHGHRVRTLVHRTDERSDRLAVAGAEIVVGDMLDLDAVVQVTTGVDGVYFAYPIRPGLMEASAIMPQAAEENRVGALVNMSQISARRDAVSNPPGSTGSPNACWTTSAGPSPTSDPPSSPNGSSPSGTQRAVSFGCRSPRRTTPPSPAKTRDA